PAVAFGGVGKVEFVPVPVPSVVPFWYPAYVEPGSQDTVLYVAGYFSEAAPVGVADRSGAGVPEFGGYRVVESLAFGGDALLACPYLQGDLVDGKGGDEEAEEGADDGRVGDEYASDEAEPAPGHGSGKDQRGVAA